MKFPQLTKGVKIILYTCLVLFIMTFPFEEFSFKYLALHIESSPNFHYSQLITHQFMHGGLIHLLFNMMGLVFLGPVVEKYYGTIRFCILYLIMGLGAAQLQMLTMTQDIPLVGASGAIFGVFALFTFLNWNRYIQIMFIPKDIKTKYVFGGYLLLEIILELTTTSSVAHAAHIGGALMGIMIHLIYHDGKIKR